MNRWMNEFHRFLESKGLRASGPRDEVARVFLSASKHVTVDELYARVQKAHPKIGIATVYRTLSLLLEGGLAAKRDFETGTAYERQGDEHHDHLICTVCGKVVEFYQPKLEQMQETIAQEHGFHLAHHKMELYGACSACASLRDRKGRA